MSVTSVGSVSGAYTYQANAAVPQKTAPDGDSAAVEAAESKTTKTAEQANGGVAPKVASASAANSSSTASNLAKLKLLASEHRSASQIAQQLGIPISTVRQEAAAAGINLNAGSTSNSPAPTTGNQATGNSSTTTAGNPAVGNNVNVKI